MKRMFCLVLVLILVLLQVGSAMAFTGPSDISTEMIQTEILEKAEQVLEYIEPSKELYGLHDVDFDSLRMGAQIYSYDVSGGTAVPTENQYYPLLDRQGNVIGLFIAYEVDGMTCVDFVSQYAEEIDMVADTSNVCLVYDGPNIFLKSENELTCLYQIVDQEPNDDSLIWNLPELSMSEIKSAAAFNLDSNDGIDMCADGTGGDVLLSVGKHTQLNDYTCWASAIWSIGTYLNKTVSMTPREVAIAYGGSEKSWALMADSVSYLNLIYGTGYVYKNQNLTLAKVKASIDANYPVAAGVTWTGNNVVTAGHEFVICGYSTESTIYTMMDPATGKYRTGSATYNKLNYSSMKTGGIYTISEYGINSSVA